MKQNSPVPAEMDYFDIQEDYIAKGWMKSHEGFPEGHNGENHMFGDYFGDSLAEGMVWQHGINIVSPEISLANIEDEETR